jgi:hypothetical protein
VSGELRRAVEVAEPWAIAHRSESPPADGRVPVPDGA